MTRSSYSRLPEHPRGFGIGFALWFAFCALVGLTFAGAIIWLIITVISWIGRQS